MGIVSFRRSTDIYSKFFEKWMHFNPNFDHPWHLLHIGSSHWVQLHKTQKKDLDPDFCKYILLLETIFWQLYFNRALEHIHRWTQGGVHCNTEDLWIYTWRGRLVDRKHTNKLEWISTTLILNTKDTWRKNNRKIHRKKYFERLRDRELKVRSTLRVHGDLHLWTFQKNIQGKNFAGLEQSDLILRPS